MVALHEQMAILAESLSQQGFGAGDLSPEDIQAAVDNYLAANPPAAVGDASTSAKGIVQLTNHLGGTATAPTVRDASTSQTGIVELATTAETTTGTDTARAVTPAGVKAVAGTKAPASHTTSADHDARYVTVVEHGAVAGTARPAGAAVVLWVGSVEPTNAVAGDQWDDASGTPSVYVEEPASEGTSGQVLTTDGAGGRTWTTISGSGDVTAANVDSEAATDGYVLTADGAGGAAWEAPPAGGGGADPWTYYVVTSDVSTTSNTASNISAMAIPSGLSSGVYEIRAHVIGTHLGGGGFAYQVLNPTGGDIRGRQHAWRGTLEATHSMMHLEGVTNAGVSYVAQQYDAWATMTVASSTSTAINITFRSITNGSTTTVKPGSFMAIRKIA